MIDEIFKLLLLDQPITWFIFSGMIILGLAQIKFIRKLWHRLEYKLFGYGSCMKCGKKRQSFWLLTCNSCYVKQFPDEAKHFGIKVIRN